MRNIFQCVVRGNQLQNQTVVEQEIKTLIADNQKLSQQVGALLKEKLHFAQTAHENSNSQELEELRRQVALLTKERDSLHVLWQTSQKTIDALDIELKTYQIYDDNRGNQKATDVKRDLELKLETALSDYIELESKYKRVHSDYNTLEAELKSKVKDIASYKERGKELEEEIAEVKKSLEEHKINLSSELKSREDIKSQLLLCQKECVDRVKKEAEAKSKVAEALQLFDLVSAQKNEAYKKIAEVTAELSTLRQTLANVQRDVEDSYRREIKEVKDNYNEKVSDMLTHIRNLDGELVEKGLLLNKALREIKILQTTNESYVKQQQNDLKAKDPKLALAEQRLEAMYHELVSSERRNIQLVCEKQCLTMDIQRIQDEHTRDRKRRDWEEQLLKTQIDEMKLQVDHLQKSLNETHEMIGKLQSMLSSRTELSQKMVSTKEEELMELNKHLENQMELNKKWKESYVDMTEKLKKKLDHLDKENRDLRNQLNMSVISSSSNHENSG
ncbi:centrosomal protein of 128 kDa isoform X2 [Bicyclus anynana]|uniref:Centrosomal protein of 128 kDa isoform X2 n=1 Tax=Bicyclus anynana TaxID=110368 RepID=A0A6J1MYV4_BICAN|nr:centrosomal protein of 128 kDa isoform X2 [Bicyclus anynana]XP_052739243.1 centrosomal protein of 128 kDa isoform X2 [Bicyclus anynana]